MNEPSINIIMNCYNGERFLQEAIDSVLNQTYKKWELIFWDNCSTDNSANIIKKYNDPRIIYYKSENHTLQYEARRQAVLKSSKELIAFLDTDDWWEKSKLEKQVKLFENEKIGFSSSNYWLFNQNTKNKTKVFRKLPSGNVLSKLLIKNFVGMSSLIIRRKSYFELPYGFNPKYEIVGDYDLVLRLSVKNEFAAIQEPLSYYRWHENNLSHKTKKNAEELEALCIEMKKKEYFFKNKNFQYFLDFSHYLSSLAHKLNNEINKALNLASKIKNIFLKTKILIIIFLPLNLINFLRS